MSLPDADLPPAFDTGGMGPCLIAASVSASPARRGRVTPRPGLLPAPTLSPMSDSSSAVGRRWQRAAAFAGLLALSGLALPLSAYVVEGISQRAENWIIVVYLLVMLLAGAAVGALLPVAEASRPKARRAGVWAGLGLLAGVVGFTVWLFAISG